MDQSGPFFSAASALGSRAPHCVTQCIAARGRAIKNLEFAPAPSWPYFFVALIASLREHDRPFAGPGSGKERHLETTVIVSPLDVPVAGGLAIFKDVCWAGVGYAHLNGLTPAAALSQHVVNTAAPGFCARQAFWAGGSGARCDEVHTDWLEVGAYSLLQS